MCSVHRIISVATHDYTCMLEILMSLTIYIPPKNRHWIHGKKVVLETPAPPIHAVSNPLPGSCGNLVVSWTHSRNRWGATGAELPKLGNSLSHQHLVGFQMAMEKPRHLLHVEPWIWWWLVMFFTDSILPWHSSPGFTSIRGRCVFSCVFQRRCFFLVERSLTLNFVATKLPSKPRLGTSSLRFFC